MVESISLTMAGPAIVPGTLVVEPGIVQLAVLQRGALLADAHLGDGHEILMIRAVVKAKAKAIAELSIGQEGTTLADCKLHDSSFYYEGAHHDAAIIDRNKLHEGLEVPGPAIVSEMDSTTVILPGYRARVDSVGNLLIEPAA